VKAGALLTYNVAYGFRAVVGQADSVLRVRPPAGTTFVSASDGGAPNSGGEVEWALGTLTPGDGGVRRLVVQVDETLPEGRLLDAQATIRRADGSGIKRANTVNRVRAAQPLSVAIDANPDPARPGDPVEVTITVTNTSATALDTNLHFIVPDLVDTVIDGDALGGAVCGAFTLGNPCERRTRILWPLSVPGRDSVTVRVDPIVSVGSPNGGVIALQSRLVNSQGSYVASARHAVHIEGGRIWDLFLDADRNPVSAAEPFNYRLTVRPRPSDAEPAEAVLQLTLPEGTVLGDAGDGATVEDGVVGWNLGSLAPGDVAERAVSLQVANGTALPALLLAEATVHDAAAPIDLVRARVLTRAAQSPISLAIEAHQDPARRGEAVQTIFTVTNNGAGNFNPFRLEARLPEGIDAFPQSLLSSASCQSSLQCPPRSVARWTMPSLQAGGSGAVLMSPIVSQAMAEGTLLRLHGRISGFVGGIGGDRNAVISRTVVVGGATPFDLAVTDSIDPIIPGQMFAYTLHYGRPGAGGATEAVLGIELPPGVFVVDADDGGVQDGDSAVDWELGALAAGASGQRTLTVIVDALPAGTPLRAHATIRDSADTASAKRADVVTTTGSPALELTVSTNVTTVAVGSPVIVSLSVTNTTAAPINNITLEGIVPPEANAFFDNTTTGGGVCGPFSFNSCEPRSRVLWPIATVGAGQSVTVTMSPVIRAGTAPGRVVRAVGRLQQSISVPPVLAVGAVSVAGN